jgi:hypothetical protein
MEEGLQWLSRRRLYKEDSEPLAARFLLTPSIASCSPDVNGRSFPLTQQRLLKLSYITRWLQFLSQICVTFVDLQQ